MSTPRAVHLLPLLMTVLLGSCCKRELQAQHRSPSGTRVLSIIRIDCHAFDSFQTEIRLGRAAGAGEIVASISSSPVVQVTWVDDSLVQIFAPARYTRNLKTADSDGVHIEFR
jgi:hypothetical protein